MQVGDVIAGAFRLREFIGRGAQGECWLVDEEPGLVWLAKIFRLDQEGWDRYDKIEREAKLLRQLDHSMIPRSRGLYPVEQESSVCLIREWVPGNNLEVYLEEHRLSESEVHQIAYRLLDVLDYIHRLSPAVIHRDIKPSNIIWRKDGHVSLIDFGSVRDSIYGESGASIVGTYGYSPPEQFLGHPTTASDIFALGATLVYLLARRHPSSLPIERNRVLFEDHINVQPRFLKILKRMLEPAVEDRFQSAADVRKAIERCEQPIRLQETQPTIDNSAFQVPNTFRAERSRESKQSRATGGKAWQRFRQVSAPWQWERTRVGDVGPNYLPNLEPVINTLLQRHSMTDVDVFSEPIELLEAIDNQFGADDEAGRQWLLRLLHPYDSADLLFGYYTPEFILPRYAASLVERFSLLLTQTSQNPIGEWVLLYFLNKHGWNPRRYWSNGKDLPFPQRDPRWSGLLKKNRHFLERFQTLQVGKQAKVFQQLHRQWEELDRLYQAYTLIRPEDLLILAKEGMKTFEQQCIERYPMEFQSLWRKMPGLRSTLNGVVMWPPRIPVVGSFIRSEKRWLYELGLHMSSLYQLFRDFDRLRSFLHNEYNWLLPDSAPSRGLD